jgi:hypothetical protein
MAGTIRINETGEFFTFDTTLNEQRDHTGEATRHPIGARANATDHRQSDPLQFTVTGRVTETPRPNQVSTKSATIQAALGGGGVVEVVGGGPERVLEAMRFMRKAEKQVVTWVSPRYGTIEDVFIERVAEPIDRPLHVDFTIDFVQLEIASRRIVDLPPEVVQKPSLTPEDDTGNQTPDTPFAGIFGGATDRSELRELQNDADDLFGVDSNQLVDTLTGG